MAATRDPRTIGVPGLILVIIGAVMLMLSFTALTWYGASDLPNSVSRSFRDLHTATDAVVGGSHAPRWYFAWVAWLMLLGVILVGLLANLPLPGGLLLRVLGFLIGIGGTLVTWYSLHQMFTHSPNGVLDNAKLGVWFAFFGFPVAGLGALLGSIGTRAPAMTQSVRQPADEPDDEAADDSDEPTD